MSESRTKAPRAGRRWAWRAAFVLAFGLAGLYLVPRLAFQLWLRSHLPPDAPRIAFSIEDAWLNELGITTTTYEQALARAGGRLIMVEPQGAAKLEALLVGEEIDGVLLTGGGDVDPRLYGGDPQEAVMVHRLRDDFEIALIHAARRRSLPILGICRGSQVLNVALGGSLRNLRQDDVLDATHFSLKGHPVALAAQSRLAQLLEVTRLPEVSSFHRQAVGAPGRGVRVVATAPDQVIEAIEIDTGPGSGWVMGVQWHPEMAVADEVQNRLFSAFVEEARRAAERRGRGAGAQPPLPARTEPLGVN